MPAPNSNTQPAPGLVRRPIVGVMGSHSDEHEQLAQPLGRWLASAGYHLLTGGGPGVMAAVCRAFTQVTDRRGLTLGIIPAADSGPVSDQPAHMAPRKGYPAPWVEIPIYTHLFEVGTRGDQPLSRNHINILTSNVVVALPGSEGTASEVRLAKEYGRPVIAYLAQIDSGPAASSPGGSPGSGPPESGPSPKPPASWPGDIPIATSLKQVQAFIERHAPIESD
jgi:predicted Rossmann-fold nucleotide-binding protein